MAKRNIHEALDAHDDAAQVRLLKKQINTLTAKNRAAENARHYAERELEEVRQRAEYYEAAPEPSPVDIEPRKHKVSGSASAMLALGDWHVEERVDPSTVNSFNEHNPTLASKKIKTTVQKAVELLNAERSMSKIGELVLCLLGDFITGYIHPELEESNYLSPTEACLFCEDHITGAIDFLLKESGVKRIIVPAVVGNHGRTTMKMRIGTSYKNSFEWYMYKHLENCYRNDPRVVWKVENGYHNYLPVQGKLVRIHHGHAFKYQGGIQGPAVPIRRKVAQWDTQKTAWMDLCGHLHTHEVISAGKVVLNGCLIGYGAYGEFAVGGKCPAMQTLIVVDKDRDIPVSIKPIFCL